MRHRYSPRLFRVLVIAHWSRMWAAATQRYMEDLNAEPCEGCGLTRGRHHPTCEVDPECPF